MGISYKANINISGIKGKINRAAAKALERMLLEEKTLIAYRTQKGLSIDNKRWRSPYDKYSEAYAKQRKKERRQVNPPDLTRTGQMLGSMTTEVKQKGSQLIGRIFFSNTKAAKKARGNLEYRKFFGLSAKRKREIIQEIRNLFGQYNNG